MKRRIGRGGVTGALAAFFLLISQTVIGAEKVYVNGFDANFPPFTYVDQSGNPDGFDIKALDWIAKEMDFRVRHQPVDWDDIVPSLRRKKIDIIASGMGITDERRKEVNFTIAYWKIKHVLVAKKEAKITAEKALVEGSKIGAQRGTREAAWIEENLIRMAKKKFELLQYDSVSLAIEEVLSGQIVAAAMEDAPALEAAMKRPVKILGGFGMSDKDYGYAVRKEDAALLKKLNEGLKRLMQSPYWVELKKTYIDR